MVSHCLLQATNSSKRRCCLTNVLETVQIDQLSKGLAHEPSLRFLALRCDTRDLKIFARDQLGARTFPSIAAYTRDADLYRLKPKGYTVKSIMSFFNDTIRVEGDAPFEIRSPELVVHSTFHSCCSAEHFCRVLLAFVLCCIISAKCRVECCTSS